MRPTVGVIVACAFGGRRWPICGNPRPLFPLATRPLVVHQIAAARAVGIQEIAIAAAPELERELRGLLGDGSELRVSLRYLTVPDPCELVEALFAVEANTDDGALLVVPGDALVADDLGRFVDAFDDGKLDALVVGGMRAEPEADQDVIAPVGTKPRTLDRDSAAQAEDGVAHLLILGGETHPAIRTMAAGSAAGSQGSQLKDLLDALLTRGARTAALAPPALSCRLETADDALSANRLLLRRIRAGRADARIVDSRIEGDVFVHETALVESSVVLGPATIGQGARLYDSYVGPYTAIGPGASLEFVELENSIVLAGAVVERVRPRLRESIVGTNSRIFGAAQVRGIRLMVGSDAEVAIP
jgi:glucose-1-phosphate thymidylyltransferase